LLAGCTTVAEPPQSEPRLASAPSVELSYEPLDPASVRTEPEPRTVEDFFLLDLYTWLHHRRYRSIRVDYPGADGADGVAHWLVPEADGPHPTVVVFPILAGSHVVSEGLAKALVNRGYSVLRMEREPLDLEKAEHPGVPAVAFEKAIADGRRLLDWLVTRPEVDPDRLAAAGVSLGGIMAATLVGVDDRLDAGFFILSGGGLPEILHDSTEKPVRRFRDRMVELERLQSREQFVELVRPFTTPVDPLVWADRIEPERVLLISGRFDRVIPPRQTELLWEGLGRPRWIRLPVGHYQVFPFFWWAVGRGADHLDQVLGAPGHGTGTGAGAGIGSGCGAGAPAYR
jgi:hypothetical protein